MKRKDAWLIALLAFAAVAFFYKIIFFRQIYYAGDWMYFFQPWTALASEGIQKGLFYLWNPYLANGEPLLANIQVAVLYPLKLVFYLLPFSWASKIYILEHFFLAGSFLYLLLRHYRLGRLAGFIGSFIFMFSGWMLVQVEFFSALGSVIWLAVVWLLWERALATGRSVYFLAVGLALALQFYAGYTFIFYYTNIAMIMYLVATRKPNLKALWMWAFLTGLIMVQLWPTAELVPHTIRTNWTFKEVSTWSLPPLFLVKFVLPGIFGSTNLQETASQPFGTSFFAIKQYWLSTFYLGILPLLFLLFSWSGRKRGYFWEIIALSSLLLSFSATFPVTRFFYQYLPLAKSFTHPASFMFFFLFALVLFISRGIDNFAAADLRLQRSHFLVLLIGGAGACGLAYFLFRYLSLLPEQKLWLETNFWQFCLKLLAAAAVLYLWYRCKTSRLVKTLVVAFVALDLVYFGLSVNPTVNDRFFSKPSGNLDLVRTELGPGRAFFEPEAQMNRLMSGRDREENYYSLRSALQPNTGLPYHVPYVFEYGYITIKNYKDLLYRARYLPSIMDSGIIDMLGGKLIFSYNKLEHPKLQLLSAKEIRIYKNTAALPDAWLVHRVKQLPAQATVDYLAGPDFDPRQEVVLEDGVTLPENGPAGRDLYFRELPVQRADTDRYRIDTESAGPGWLVNNDIYFPGWNARLDNQRINIYKADYILKAVPVPAGTHQVEFIYQPVSFYGGLIVTLLTLLSVTVILLKKWNFLMCSGV